MVKSFALIGAAGYVAPRHMQAIAETGQRLVAAFDPHDSVGILDSYFPEAEFFSQWERFDRHLDKWRRSSSPHAVDCISICSPNYLHDAHIRFALRAGADAICEKPLVLNPWNLERLLRVEEETGKRVSTILQLRLHPQILELKSEIEAAPPERSWDVDLTCVTVRGNWYTHSWKGDESQSGGIATNIGVHYFDLLHYLFGNVQRNIVHLREARRAAGYLEYERARVRWFLSVEAADLPEELRASGQRAYRMLVCAGRPLEFSSGFTHLHTRSYEEILAGRGFGVAENRVAIETVAAIREQSVAALREDYHPWLCEPRATQRRVEGR